MTLHGTVFQFCAESPRALQISVDPCQRSSMSSIDSGNCEEAYVRSLKPLKAQRLAQKVGSKGVCYD